MIFIITRLRAHSRGKGNRTQNWINEFPEVTKLVSGKSGFEFHFIFYVFLSLTPHCLFNTNTSPFFMLPGNIDALLLVEFQKGKKKNQTPGLNWLLYFSIKARAPSSGHTLTLTQSKKGKGKGFPKVRLSPLLFHFFASGWSICIIDSCSQEYRNLVTLRAGQGSGVRQTQVQPQIHHLLPVCLWCYYK